MRPGKQGIVEVFAHNPRNGFLLNLDVHGIRKVTWLSQMSADDWLWKCTVADEKYPLTWTLYTFQFGASSGCKVFLDSKLMVQNNTKTRK